MQNQFKKNNNNNSDTIQTFGQRESKAKRRIIYMKEAMGERSHYPFAWAFYYIHFNMTLCLSL